MARRAIMADEGSEFGLQPAGLGKNQDHKKEGPAWSHAGLIAYNH